MKHMIDPEVEGNYSKSIQGLTSILNPQYQELDVNVEQIMASKRQKIIPLDSPPSAISRSCKHNNHCRSVFQRLIQESPSFKYLHPKKVVVLLKFWGKNHG
ncbi:hypothetical protein PGTUg99_013087 [Puccinia graminis f. sp. tritici]|nr:hypothetical protein PGTUg99_013087 [Puccinia graminis f. sp. tritici]